jgi:hypothetical protein
LEERAAVQMTGIENPGGDVPEDEPEEVGGRRSPLRRCIVTGTVQPKEGMVRFALAPDGTVVPDLEERLPGRGYWVTADRETLVRAVAKNMFTRAARRPVKAAADLPDRVGTLLRQRCLDLLGMARRAGQAVAGFEKVREALKGERAAVLLAASDGAEDGKAKLRGLSRGTVPEISLFTASEVGAAMGRDIAVHAALSSGGLAQRFLAECRRLAGLAPGQ